MAIVEEMNSFHTYAFPNAKSIIVCGDIHGEFNAVIYKLCIQYQMTELLPETLQEGHGRHSLRNSVSGLFNRTPLWKTLLQKHEEDSENQAHESGEVVPMKGFTLEEEGDNESEDDQRDNFLNDF